MSDSAESITPAVSLETALPLLRRPPAPRAVRFKPLSDLGDRCQVVAYTDARFVVDQLNAVCAGGWHAVYEPLPERLCPSPSSDPEDRMLYARCALTVLGVTRADVGESRDSTRFGGGPKAVFSDALKRAAVHFGVNQAIYAMRTPWLEVHAANGVCPAGKVRRSAKGSLYVPEATERILRHGYQRWLQSRGAAFGTPIDFGEDDVIPGTDADAATAPSTAEVVSIAAARAGRDGATPPAIPAAVEDRRELHALASGVGLDDVRLQRLALLVCGVSGIERLGGAQVGDLRTLLRATSAAGAAAQLSEALSDEEPGDRAADLLARLRGHLTQRGA